MSNDLLPRVEVCKLTYEIVELVRNIIRQELRAQQAGVTLIGGLTVQKAADYVGVSKRQFWNLLKDDPELDASSFSIGVRRYWRRDVLDSWMASRANQNDPKQDDP
jgi:Helix-turn-helix domain